jgi:hypothetical protein
MRALAALALVLMAASAFAHGRADWVRRGAYKNQMGELCCGERDCGLFQQGTINRVPGGYEVDAVFEVDYHGKLTPFPVKGFIKDEDATPSPTGDYWACSWGGQVKCFFAPLPGM